MIGERADHARNVFHVHADELVPPEACEHARSVSICFECACAGEFLFGCGEVLLEASFKILSLHLNGCECFVDVGIVLAGVAGGSSKQVPHFFWNTLTSAFRLAW